MTGADDGREIVRRGYDALSHRYRSGDADEGEYAPWIAALLDRLPAGAAVLDLGCGCGVPVARALAAAGHRVTGVDISDVQIDRARALVPGATFLRADATEVDFPPASFHAVVCLYAVIHLPLAEQPALIRRIGGWLRPSGLVLATVGAQAWTGIEDGWLGGTTAMWWSHADAGTYRRWFAEAGLTVTDEQFVAEGDGGHTLLWARNEVAPLPDRHIARFHTEHPPAPPATAAWRWDPTLYAGSAPHYGPGRMSYPVEVADAVRDELGLDGTGRLLDVGCGPGSLTLLLAPLVGSAVGVDADPDMIAAARRTAAVRGVRDVAWRCLRAEDLPAGLGTFRVVTFAQSFHWMDQELVAGRVRGMLDPGGAWVHVAATTHRGVPGEDPLPEPRPPWDRIDSLVAGYLGAVRRAGRSTLPAGTRAGEEDVMRRAGFTGPTRIEVGGDAVVHRSADEVVSAVFSLSSSAPHLFGDALGGFEAELRSLLRDASSDGRFCERLGAAAVVIWRP